MFTSIKLCLALLIALLAPVPAADLELNECSPGGCCTWVSSKGIHCDPGSCEGGGSYQSCPTGTCMEGSCLQAFGKNFSDECCSTPRISIGR